MSQVSYPYAIGRIRVNETHLIDRAKWHRLMDADEIEALKALEEHGYGVDCNNRSSVEMLINAEIKKANILINEVSPDKSLTDVLLLPTDAHNIKAMIKAKILGVDYKDYLIDAGSIELESLVKGIEAKEYSNFPTEIAETLSSIENETDPRVISLKIDNSVYTYMLRVLKKNRNALVKKYVETKIGFTNLLTVIRGNTLGWSTSKITPLLIQGGEFDQKLLIEAVGIAPDMYPKHFGKGEFSNDLKTILEKFSTTKNIGQLEQLLDNILYKIVYEQRNDSFGIGPIIHYYLIRNTEGRALRMMFAEKRAGIKSNLVDLGIVV